jgi:hypothetical protein
MAGRNISITGSSADADRADNSVCGPLPREGIMKKMILIKAVAVALCIGGAAKAGPTERFWGRDGKEHVIPVMSNYRDCMKNAPLVKCSREQAENWCGTHYSAGAPGSNSKK